MRKQGIATDISDRADYTAERPLPESVQLEREASGPASGKVQANNSSYQPQASTPLSLGKSKTDEVKVQADGLSILFRLLLDGRRTQLASVVVDGPTDIRSGLSIAFGNIVEELRGAAQPGSGSSSEPALIIVGMCFNEEPVVEPCVPQTMLRVGPLYLDLLDRTAMRGGRKIDLRPREFQLLRYMMERRGKVLTRADLLRDVWHCKFFRQTNLVDVHMGRLRRKVDGSNEHPTIRSVYRAGFVIDTPIAGLASEVGPMHHSTR